MKKAILIIVTVCSIGLIVIAFLGFGNYDHLQTIAYATENAAPKSQSLCARYVRKAIQAGGVRFIARPASAYKYADFLPVLGFEEIEEPYQPGDIVVFNQTGGRKHGHIAIYTGKGWVSDFKQRSFYVHSDYISSKDYKVFRKEDGPYYNNLFKQLYILL